MLSPRKLGAIAALAVVAAALTVAGPAAAASRHGLDVPDRGAVFVQTDNPAGNAIAVYDRGPGGVLSAAGAYPTGGNGGVLAGSIVDHLASQNSLVYDGQGRLLFAVNAGSDTVSVFAVCGDRLFLRQVVSSGGTFPVSIAVHGDLAYVLNALAGGSVQGFRIAFGYLIPMPGSLRALGLDSTATPQYTNAPGDVAFTPDGSSLIVTTKANGNDVDLFDVGFLGYLSAAPVVNSEPGAVPFAVAFDPAGHVVISEAGPNAVASFSLATGGALDALSSIATSQSATCWLVADGQLLFAGNAGSGSESSVAATPAGLLTLLATTATDAGTVDAATTPDGRFLYVQTGAAGIVETFRVAPGGTLTEAGPPVTVPGAVGGEGIATS